MNNKVTVTADLMGNVIGISPNNPEYGYIRVQQSAKEISADGWFKFSKRSALIKGLTKDLQDAGFQNGETLPGKIIVVESFEPVNPDNTDQGLKIAGETGVICRVDDQPIYRQQLYTTNLDAQDQLIQHNNAEEIREVQNASKSIDALVNARDAVSL